MTGLRVQEAPTTVTLNDKWELENGQFVITGAQAIARALLAQGAMDRRNGLHTAGYISGYRGSPLGTVDSALWAIGDRLKRADILFRPGVNEDLAATAISGTQQIDAVPGARFDGVFAAWYGKGPGVDRSLDALKHGNAAGTHRNGGVVAFYGDDHAGKSSTVSHQSEQAMASCLIPSLYPSSVEELIEFTLIGYALSRYSGCWVGIKCVNEVAEQTATVAIDFNSVTPVLPPIADDSAAPIHITNRRAFNPLGEEQILVERRLPLVQAFIKANRIDRTVIDAPERKLGIVTSGKAHGDTLAALALLGLDDAAAAAAGISLYKVGCIWPLEASGIEAFAQNQSALMVVEEKRAFVEEQIAAVLINRPQRPLLIGKRDADGAPLLSSTTPLDPVQVSLAIASQLDRMGMLSPAMRAARDTLGTVTVEPVAIKRQPYFCSGCPHNNSTRIPEGSIAATGIGCHTMVNFVRPDISLLPSQMGSEGSNWVGLAPFTDTPHLFQNMGDGTYYHSGLLSVRAAVAAGTNITFKILYNDAVAMTGGQPVDGPISVAEIARQVKDEGVKRVVVLSDNPDAQRRGGALPSDVYIGHRHELDAVQRQLREEKGCTVLIYEQTCAAEKRRRRKRGQFPDPAKRLFIAKEVCEGCGDCSVQSTCVSLVPQETAFGRKRAIDQSSCNKDYSCLDGFCPSFITVTGAELRKPEAVQIGDDVFDALPPAPVAPMQDRFSMLVAGIGGTGVVTVGAILGMAAHIEGKAMSIFDMTGLAQKNGAVYSHLVIAADARDLHTAKIGRGGTDLMLAFDLVAANAPDAVETLKEGRTRIIANHDMPPTVAFQFDRNLAMEPTVLLARLRRLVGKDAVDEVRATEITRAIVGDTIATNLFLVGVAAQRGILPVGTDAIERAIVLNGVAVAFNQRAFRLGRLLAADPGHVIEMARSNARPAEALPQTVDEIVAHRTDHLRRYQNDALAARYQALVDRVRQAEAAAVPGSDALALAVARNYAKLLAYKDEYEVARMLSDPALHADIRRTFADGARIHFNMAPPVLPAKPVKGRPGKREFGAWMLPALGLLARFKWLRGTALDPFGRTEERRMERGLIDQYEALVETVLANLRAANHDRAVILLTLADEVRGYGPVKQEAVEIYRTDVREAEHRFLTASTGDAPQGPASSAALQGAR